MSHDNLKKSLKKMAEERFTRGCTKVIDAIDLGSDAAIHEVENFLGELNEFCQMMCEALPTTLEESGQTAADEPLDWTTHDTKN